MPAVIAIKTRKLATALFQDLSPFQEPFKLGCAPTRTGPESTHSHEELGQGFALSTP